MKALLIATQLPPKGRSAGRLALEYGKLLLDAGVQVELLTATPLGPKPTRRLEGLTVHVLQPDLDVTAPHVQATFEAVLLARRVADLLRIAEPPDVVITFDWAAALAGSMLKQVARTPLLHLYNGSIAARHPANPVNQWVWKMEEWAVSRADAVTCPGAASLEDLGRRFPRLPIPVAGIGCTVTRWGQGIEVDREEFRLMFATPEESLVLFVGESRPASGLNVLLEAVPQILSGRRNTRFAVVGECNLPPELETLRTSDRIRFTSELGEPAFLALLQVADVLVAPRRYDANGILLWEAVANGLPVISTPSRSAYEVAQAGAELWPLDPLKADRLAALLLRRLETPVDRALLRKRGSRICSERARTATQGLLAAIEAAGRRGGC